MIVTENDSNETLPLLFPPEVAERLVPKSFNSQTRSGPECFLHIFTQTYLRGHNLELTEDTPDVDTVMIGIADMATSFKITGITKILENVTNRCIIH